MKPGQLNLNEFEIAILEQIAMDEPSLLPLIPKLHVLSRKYTGVGSYTNFLFEGNVPVLANKKIGNPKIVMPNVPNGLGAILFCENGKPIFLETYTYGSDHWDGNHQGFSIKGSS